MKPGTRLSGHGDLDGLVGGEDRAVVGEPLHRVRRAESAEPLLDAAHHHVADHLAAGAGGGNDPADDLTLVAIKGKGDPQYLAFLAGEL